MIKNLLVVKISIKVTSLSTDYTPVTFISRREYRFVSETKQLSCCIIWQLLTVLWLSYRFQSIPDVYFLIEINY